MRALTRCLPWARAPRDPTDPAPVAPSPRPSGEVAREVEVPGLPPPSPRDVAEVPLIDLTTLPPVRPASAPAGDVGHLAPARPAPRPRPAEPKPRPLPAGARSPRCARSLHGNERRIETEHYRYHAVRPGAGRLWAVAAYPASAAARYYVDARGEPLTFTCPLAALPTFIAQTERELAGYWGEVLDTRREWD